MDWEQSEKIKDDELIRLLHPETALDNIRTERFFRSLKYDNIYIKEYTTPKEMIAGVNNYTLDYNAVRPHASLGGLTSNIFYQQQPTKQPNARSYSDHFKIYVLTTGAL